MKASMGKLSIAEDFIANFEIHQDEIFLENSDRYIMLRKSAIAAFETLGIPSRMSEEWKYTNVAKALKRAWVQFPLKTEKLTENDIRSCLIPGLDAHILVFLNGIRVPFTESDSNHEVVRDFGEFISNSNVSPMDNESDAFDALNLAFANDGAIINIPDNSVLDKPLYLLYISSHDDNLFVQNRNVIDIGKNSEATIIEARISLSSNNDFQVFSNNVTEIRCANNSNLDHYQFQIKGQSTTASINKYLVKQEADSTYTSTNINLGGQLVRNNVEVVHEGEGCETNLSGLYHLISDQHLDNHTLIDHKMPNCNSNELYIGILDDHSTGVFNGKVLVRKDAQKTNAFQSNKNILLTDDAKMNAKPQLEIYADDVKCSHGATTGQMNQEALFYLRSRGISKKLAQTMLMEAFMKEVLDKIKIEELKNFLTNILELRLNISH
ncbi:MAG TPA: Fe-S cluster assembly protein SufD [Flavobacteriales bacterium]|nr:Fe-S cluster assembly protein SufD [Flavobacteriales bacterium]